MKIKGLVIKGKGEGKRLGFPTANINILNKVHDGVYSARVLALGKKYRGAVFVAQNILEVYLINFSGDLYGKNIEVDLIKKIRDVVSFESEDQMKKLISEDIRKIKLKSKGP